MNNYSIHDTLLKIDNIYLKYGDRVILNGVNAEIRNIEREGFTQGQVVCFLGPSGIGKTQLARIIAGLNTPTSGTVSLVGGIPTVAGRVGFVQQSYPLFGYMTARQNLEVAMKMGNLKDSAKIDSFCGVLGISRETQSLYPKQLSGGQRQRVAIIRQLLCSEHFIILDEPFSGLDIKAKQAACKLITDVAALDTLNTIIVITHDVTEGMSVADQVWLMGRKIGQPGASIVADHNLAEMGLAWDPDIQHKPEFIEFVRHVKDEFLAVAN